MNEKGKKWFLFLNLLNDFIIVKRGICWYFFLIEIFNIAMQAIIIDNLMKTQKLMKIKKYFSYAIMLYAPSKLDN